MAIGKRKMTYIPPPSDGYERPKPIRVCYVCGKGPDWTNEMIACGSEIFRCRRKECQMLVLRRASSKDKSGVGKSFEQLRKEAPVVVTTYAVPKEKKPAQKTIKDTIIEVLKEGKYTMEEVAAESGAILSTTKIQVGYHLPKQGFKINKETIAGITKYWIEPTP
jgi:hypothetical protein